MQLKKHKQHSFDNAVLSLPLILSATSVILPGSNKEMVYVNLELLHFDTHLLSVEQSIIDYLYLGLVSDYINFELLVEISIIAN